ncbi:TPA: hypothetical protein ACXE54_001511 [Klebsiella michiganensis]|uniref:hypothetical protein n=1 Tax=Klebsiella michiganensis TaxID=1134687 RepID=UPI001CCFA2B2|nr:hypothetical protein [Klebsiella michiganensis]MBZ7426848.1 hypothetical protein [Klebsiella michiganensis]MBZ7477941.1 hypothetical protein [Klebsiella michiganensis]
MAVATKLRNDSSILSVNISSAGYYNHIALAQRRPDIKQRAPAAAVEKVAARDTGCCSLENDKDSSRGTLSLFTFASSIRNFSIRSSDKPVFHASQGFVSVISPFIF